MKAKREELSGLVALERARDGMFAKADLVAIAMARRAGGDPFAIEASDVGGLPPAPRWVKFKGQAHLALSIIAEVEQLLVGGRVL